jgi:hypothetical protein
MLHAPGRVAVAVAIGAMAMLTGCGTPGSSAGPKLHLQAVDAVRVISPHLSASRTAALVPKDHYMGILAGAVTTCGTQGVNLTPPQMARHPVDVTLWHDGKQISAVRLERRSGFAFLIVGGSVVHLEHIDGTHEQPTGWSPSFTIRTSDGFATPASLGGLPGIGEEVFQIPSRPHIHPCYPSKPKIPDNNLVSIQQACQTLSFAVGSVSPATGEHALMITLTNTAKTTCRLFGYPGVELSTSSGGHGGLPPGTLGGQMAFKYVDGKSPYMSDRPPSVVNLAPGVHAYVEVAKYRCDLGEVSGARTLRLSVPISGLLLTIPISQSARQGVRTLSYCRGGPHDPGNVVSISAVSASIQQLVPK